MGGPPPDLPSLPPPGPLPFPPRQNPAVSCWVFTREQQSACFDKVVFELHLFFQQFAARSLAFSDLRSEEHTSELQSQSNLVCRLLLEKKKHNLSDCITIGPSC